MEKVVNIWAAGDGIGMVKLRAGTGGDKKVKDFLKNCVDRGVGIWIIWA